MEISMISQRAKNLDPYVPGEQPKDREYIKLNANENPYAPSGKVIEALSHLITHKPLSLALYPDPDSSILRSAIARSLNESSGVLGTMGTKTDHKKLSISPDMIFCGNGSDEVLSVLFYSFFNDDKPLVAPEHSYSFYPVYCGYYGIPLNKIPLNKDFTLDTESMLRAAHESCCGLIFANPNAPTSLALSVENIRKMLEDFPADKAFVVDEAYVDFSDESALCLLSEFKNLVIVRTFSKSFSFAGMRLGYAVANPELIEVMTRVKNSFNHFPVDIAAQTAGTAACNDTGYYAENARKIISQRQRLIKFLRNNGWMCYESKTNFILAKKDGISGKEVYEKVKHDGILVRHFNTPVITEYVRISIGTEQQMDMLIKSLEKI
jgi:histidinol-phosphate aminotransferase